MRVNHICERRLTILRKQLSAIAYLVGLPLMQNGTPQSMHPSSLIFSFSQANGSIISCSPQPPSFGSRVRCLSFMIILFRAISVAVEGRESAARRRKMLQSSCSEQGAASDTLRTAKFIVLRRCEATAVYWHQQKITVFWLSNDRKKRFAERALLNLF